MLLIRSEEPVAKWKLISKPIALSLLSVLAVLPENVTDFLSQVSAEFIV